ncbi:MAG TPA: glycosyltransferase family 2 protein, partial [Solirubrobacteraceae bacterium]|nr:glycosyltransferase family 2 protein [Solirubrobacteraceae bacterium]
MSRPRVVVGAPLFEKERWLPAALESLLGQTFRDVAFLLVDDRSGDRTAEIARAFAARDPRVQVHVNDRRLGMLGNTNRALALARERFPQAEYWALGSDHDAWDPRFLEVLVGLLDAHPRAVLAYPLSRRIDANGALYPGQKPPPRLDTRGVADPRARVAHAFGRMAAGDMIYGVFRLSALPERLYRPVLVPDRLLLTELAVAGEFAQAGEVLWHRRFRGLADLERQKRAFFLDGVPRYAAAPWWAQHTALLVRDAAAG